MIKVHCNWGTAYERVIVQKVVGSNLYSAKRQLEKPVCQLSSRYVAFSRESYGNEERRMVSVFHMLYQRQWTSDPTLPHRPLCYRKSLPLPIPSAMESKELLHKSLYRVI